MSYITQPRLSLPNFQSLDEAKCSSFRSREAHLRFARALEVQRRRGQGTLELEYPVEFNMGGIEVAFNSPTNAELLYYNSETYHFRNVDDFKVDEQYIADVLMEQERGAHVKKAQMPDFMYDYISDCNMIVVDNAVNITSNVLQSFIDSWDRMARFMRVVCVLKLDYDRDYSHLDGDCVINYEEGYIMAGDSYGTRCILRAMFGRNDSLLERVYQTYFPRRPVEIDISDTEVEETEDEDQALVPQINHVFRIIVEPDLTCGN